MKPHATMPSAAEVTDPKTAEIARSRLAESVAEQRDTGNAVDTKIGVFAASGTGLLAILLAVLALRPHSGPAGAVAVLVVVASYAVLVMTTAIGLWPTWWWKGPSPQQLLQLARQRETARTLQHAVLHSLSEAQAFNSEKLRLKGAALRATYVLLVLESVGFVVAIVPLAWSGPVSHP
jgi:hypothetical protein